jgi:site-specific recombinase XerD
MNKVYNTFFSEEIWEKVNQDNKDLMKDFCLELKQKQRAESTIKAYEYDIKGIFCYIYNYLDNQYILDLTKKDFRKYSIYLVEECSVSNARHNRLLSALRSMLDFAENEEEEYDYDINVVGKVNGLPKNPVKNIVFLCNDQVLCLIDKLIEMEEYQKATLLALSYDSAARRGELVQVQKYSFLDKNKNNTNVVIGKGNKRFVLLYFDLTKKCVELWLNQRGKDDIDSLWVVGSDKKRRPASKKNLYDFFIYIRKLLEKIEEASIRLTPHSLRHSALQNLSDGTHYLCKEKNNGGGYEIEKLKLLANHSSIETTSNYLKDTKIDELESMFDISIGSLL